MRTTRRRVSIYRAQSRPVSPASTTHKRTQFLLIRLCHVLVYAEFKYPFFTNSLIQSLSLISNFNTNMYELIILYSLSLSLFLPLSPLFHYNLQENTLRIDVLLGHTASDSTIENLQRIAVKLSKSQFNTRTRYLRVEGERGETWFKSRVAQFQTWAELDLSHSAISPSLQVKYRTRLQWRNCGI